jgi:hypothetical protein
MDGGLSDDHDAKIRDPTPHITRLGRTGAISGNRAAIDREVSGVENAAAPCKFAVRLVSLHGAINKSQRAEIRYATSFSSVGAIRQVARNRTIDYRQRARVVDATPLSAVFRRQIVAGNHHGAQCERAVIGNPTSIFIRT